MSTSDFETNEYADLIGGRQLEPEEQNPMLGWRGASRFYSEAYRVGFALECRAVPRALGDGLRERDSISLASDSVLRVIERVTEVERG